MVAVKADLENSTLTWLLKVQLEPENSNHYGEMGLPAAEPFSQHETASSSNSEMQENPMGFDDGASDAVFRKIIARMQEDRVNERAQNTMIQRGAEEPFQIDILPSPSSNMNSHHGVEVTCDEVFLIVVWAMKRCALWEEAPDSKLLLDSVRKLSDVVHVA